MVIPVRVPCGCQDSFLAAFWARPEEYLDHWRRTAMSGFAQLRKKAIQQGLDRLTRDLYSGAWHQRFRELLTQQTLDAGYRLLIAEAVTRPIRFST
jgi:hypothetical protein